MADHDVSWSVQDSPAGVLFDMRIIPVDEMPDLPLPAKEAVPAETPVAEEPSEEPRHLRHRASTAPSTDADADGWLHRRRHSRELTIEQRVRRQQHQNILFASELYYGIKRFLTARDADTRSNQAVKYIAGSLGIEPAQAKDTIRGYLENGDLFSTNRSGSQHLSHEKVTTKNEPSSTADNEVTETMWSTDEAALAPHILELVSSYDPMQGLSPRSVHESLREKGLIGDETERHDIKQLMRKLERAGELKQKPVGRGQGSAGLIFVHSTQDNWLSWRYETETARSDFLFSIAD
jgi:hypothetical protein